MLNRPPLNSYGICLKTDTAFSSLDSVGQCMADRMRSKQFDRAIRSVVQPHHSVVDVSTGSGLLALFAARAGARRVLAVEFDPYIAEVARENIRNNGYEQVIEVIEADARDCRFEPGASFDVVIMEMLTTGMVDEFQIPAVKNLQRQGVVNSSTIFVPCRQETFAALAHTKFEIYGLKMRMVRHIWEGFPDNQTVDCLSRPQLISSTDFSAPCAEEVVQTLEFEAVESGLVNSVYVTSRTCLTPQISLKDTLTLNAPVAIPIEERMVVKGERVAVDLSYFYGGGYNNFRSSFPRQKPCRSHPMNWVSPKVQARMTDERGRGVFAVEPIATHERIAVFGGHVVTFDVFDTLSEACQHYSYQIADDLIYAYLDVAELGEIDCFNHSCAPNAGFRGHIELVALRDIAAGEEVTFDYATCLTASFGDMDCLCGAANCRSRVTGEDWKLTELQERYRGHFQPYIEDKIARLRAENGP
jgi:uncharacterized protein